MNLLSIRRRFVAPAKGEAGATMVEFALVGGFLFFFIISTAELLRLTYTGLTLQYVVTNTVRTAVLGPADPVRVNSEQEYFADAADIGVSMINLAAGLGIEVQNSQIEICDEVNPNCGTLDDGGSSRGETDKMVVVRIRYPMRIFWYGTYLIDAVAVGKNERF